MCVIGNDAALCKAAKRLALARNSNDKPVAPLAEWLLTPAGSVCHGQLHSMPFAVGNLKPRGTLELLQLVSS